MGLILIFGLSTSFLHQPKRREIDFCFDVPKRTAAAAFAVFALCF